MTTKILSTTLANSTVGLRPAQLVWLATAIFVVSASYGALLPILPSWLTQLIPGMTVTEIARHIGLLSGVYTAGVLVGAPIWGAIGNSMERGQILNVGLAGYVASLLLVLVPGLSGLLGLYVLRGATGFFVAAVIPVVSTLVAEHTAEKQRARRFAWLGAISLLGFLFGPGLNAIAEWVGSWVNEGTGPSAVSARVVIVLSALLGAVTMLGLARTLPALSTPEAEAQNDVVVPTRGRTAAIWLLNGAVMFVLAGFEVGIVLQGQQHTNLSTRQVAIMFAECSLVMLGVNALLFFTALLERASARKLIGAGLVLAMLGLAVLAQLRFEAWLYWGISFTSAGTGLILPTIAYLAAGTSREKLGTTMGGLAAAAGVGQTLGSVVGGWLFAVFAQSSFGWLTVPLFMMAIPLLIRRDWWSTIPGTFSYSPMGQSVNRHWRV